MWGACDVDCLTLFEAPKIMALKFKFKSKDEIPAEHVSLDVERDGAFVLDAEGAVEPLLMWRWNPQPCADRSSDSQD